MKVNGFGYRRTELSDGKIVIQAPKVIDFVHTWHSLGKLRFL